MIALLATALKRFARKQKGKRKQKRKAQRRRLSDGTYLQQIAAATQGGENNKLQFPYKLPVIETEVSLDAATHKTLKKAVLVLSGGIALAGVAVAISNVNKSKS